MASKTLTINHAGGGSETYTVNRDKFAGVRQMSRGYVYPAFNLQTHNQTYYTVAKTDNRNWVVVNNLVNDTLNGQAGRKFQTLVSPSKMHTGKHRVSFDVELISGSLADIGTDFSIRFTYRDIDETSDSHNVGALRVTEGSNVFDFEIFDDGDSVKPTIYLAHHEDGDYEVSITNLKVTHEPDTITTNHTAVPKEQSRETTFGGTQSITIKRDIEPLLTNVVGGASAAYSLRDLNDKAGNSKVVKVRRSSDQAEKTFTAKEVPQIADWVNENDSGDVIGFTLSGSGDSDADGVYTLKRYVSGRPQFNKAHPEGSIWFIYVLSGSSGYWRLKVFESDPNDAPEDPADTMLNGVIEDTDYPWEATYTAGNPVFSDLTVEASDGFVETWYDQSGNNNHATQTFEDRQPKIVESGSYLGELDFDGSDDGLFTTHSFTDMLTHVSLFTVTKNDLLNPPNDESMVRIRPNGAFGSLDGFVFEQKKDHGFSGNTAFDDGVNAVSAHSHGRGVRTTSEVLTTLLYQPSQILGHRDGSLIETMNTVRAGSLPLGSVTLQEQLWLGQNFDSNDRPFNGRMKEIIIYFDDQSANRPAIEKNINNHYEIF